MTNIICLYGMLLLNKLGPGSLPEKPFSLSGIRINTDKHGLRTKMIKNLGMVQNWNRHLYKFLNANAANGRIKRIIHREIRAIPCFGAVFSRLWPYLSPEGLLSDRAA